MRPYNGEDLLGGETPSEVWTDVCAHAGRAPQGKPFEEQGDACIAAAMDLLRAALLMRGVMFKAENLGQLMAARTLLWTMWKEADRWTGPTASSHFRSEIQERLHALGVEV